MAQRKRKHGKVEARKSRPLIRFKPGVLLVLIFIAFASCFALYLVSATSQEDYWEREIVGTPEATGETIPVETGEPSAAVNPVPESPAADAGRMSICAWIGEVSELTTYYQTASGMVFPDAVSRLSDSEMRKIAETLAEEEPLAVYIWMNTPAKSEDMRTLAEQLREHLPEQPVYLLSALPPVEDAQESRLVNDWNAELFALADELGLYYVDISTALKGNDGFLAPEYTDEKRLYTAVGEAVLTHVAAEEMTTEE